MVERYKKEILFFKKRLIRIIFANLLQKLSLKHIILLFAVVSSCCNIFAQEQYPEDPVYFELGGGDIEVQGIFELHGGGILVLTGKKAFINIESSLHERKLHCFNSKLQHMWTKPLLENYNAGFEDWSVLSNEEYIYFITAPHLPGMTLKMNITQIRRQGGKTRKVFVNDNKDPKTLFIDEDNIYVLRYFEREEFILTKVDHNTFDKTEIKLNIPDVRNTPNTIANKRWDFLGFANNAIYMYKKNVSLKAGKEYSFYVIKLSKDGRLMNGFNLNAIMDKHYVHPSNNPHIGQFRPEKDYKKRIFGSLDPTISSYGDIYLDTQTDMVYVFGQYGNKRCNKLNCSYDGVFLQKFTLSGKLLWKSSGKFLPLFKERDPLLGSAETNKFNKRLMDISIDNHANQVNLSIINVKKGTSWAYLMKFDQDGNYLTSIRGSSSERPYVKNRSYNQDPFNYFRYYYYDSYYKHDDKINTQGEFRFQELANLTPELDMGYYELFALEKGEVVFEKENGRKTIVFYYVKRDEED